MAGEARETEQHPDERPVLQVSGISKAFPGVVALSDVSLDLRAGEVHCLMGENGAGKSTLIKILTGVYRPDSGAMLLHGKPLHAGDPRRAQEAGIGAIHQEVDLVPELSVAENIFLGRPPTRFGFVKRAAMRGEAQRHLDRVGISVSPDTKLKDLDLAHQQEVAVAKALSLQASVMIFDEPTASFTRAEVERLFALIGSLKAAGIAILYVSHHLDEIFEIGDRITVLKDGRFQQSAPVSQFTHETLIQAMVGREVDLFANWVPADVGEELLRVERLQTAVVKEVSLSVRRGEIVGLAGLVGAGRSETARAIIGADPVKGGAVFVSGKRQVIGSPSRAAALGIGMVPEDRKGEGLILNRSVMENSGYARLQLAKSRGLPPIKAIRKKCAELLSAMAIRPADPRIAAGLLSGGNQQKVVLTRWLAAEAELLILDEPTRGVDVGAKAEIYGIMQRLKSEGKGVLMISSDLLEILSQSDRVVVMAAGQIRGELTREEATEERVLQLALSATSRRDEAAA